MSWIEGKVNSRKLVQTLISKIVGSGHGWDKIPSFDSPDISVSHPTVDGTIIKKTVNGNEIFLGFHQLVYTSSAIALVIHLYTDYKASPTLDKLGTFTDRRYHRLYLGRLADSGADMDTAGYGMRYKISVTDERVIFAVKCDQSLDNSWSVYHFGAFRNTSDTEYNENAYAVFTSWGHYQADYYELMLYHRGAKKPQKVLCQGIYNLSNNGQVDTSELISPLRVKNGNGGNEGFLDMYVSISNNAFREGDEIEVNGRLYEALTVNMYPTSLSTTYFRNSLNYAHVGICNVLIPKE